MTNEEAIRILGRMLDEFCNEDSYAPECKDAVDMAIEALTIVNSPSLTLKRLGEFHADVMKEFDCDTDVR